MALTKVSTPGIKDEAITLAKLLHGDSNNNGKFLRANNGADPTFETIDLTALNASNLTSGTIPDARFPSALPAIDGSALTGITSTTINNNADNRILTGTGTANTIQGEPQLTFDANGLLRINAPDGGLRYFFGETGNTKSAQLSLYDSSDQQKVRIAAGETNAAEANTFFNGGNVGIGSSNPNRGSHSRALTISHTGTGARSAIEVEGNTANCHAALEFYKNGALVSGLNSRGTDRLQFICGSSGTVRGQFTPNGLNFGSDTAAANALDDYEEGTWTPFVMYYYNGAWYATTMTSVGTKSAKYTKIGDVVYVDMEWHSWEVQNANYALISGLPFTSSSRGAFTVTYTNCFQNNQNLGGMISNNSTFIEFYRDNNSWNAIKNNSSGMYIYGAGVYKAS